LLLVLVLVVLVLVVLVLVVLVVLSLPPPPLPSRGFSVGRIDAPSTRITPATTSLAATAMGRPHIIFLTRGRMV
jgi:hypothetical protein